MNKSLIWIGALVVGAGLGLLGVPLLGNRKPALDYRKNKE